MAYKMKIKGKVHDIDYRLFLLEETDSLFIPCFNARNEEINGKKALMVLADSDKEQIEQFLEFVKSNKPEEAIFEEISVEEFKGRVRDIEKFRTSFNTSQLSKIVQIGVRMLEKQDKMLEKQDTMLSKIDLMLEKQDETIKVIREEEKTREELGKKIEDVGYKVDEVGKKVDDVARKIDKTNDELEMLRSDFRDYLENNLKEINSRISRIEDALRKAGLM